MKPAEANDSTDIFNDILLLYELSLSIGRSLDIQENCRGFLDTLMARKNLAYAAVWVRNASLPGHAPDDGISLLYADPMHLTPAEPPGSIFELVDGREFVAFSRDDAEYTCLLGHFEHPFGACALFPLADFGVLKLCAPPSRPEFSVRELNQLRNVMQKFAISLQGNLAHQQAVHESRRRKLAEMRLRTLFDNAIDIICAVDLNTLQIIDISPAVQSITGFRPEELTGRSMRSLKLLSPASLRDLLGYARQMRAGRTTVTGVSFEMLARDGTPRFVEGSATALVEDGKANTMISVVRDITWRREHDETLARLAASVEYAQDAIIISDLEARIQYVNPAFEQMTGYSAGDSVGCYMKMLRSGRHPVSFYDDMLEAVRRGEVWRGVLSIRCKDGSLREVERNLAPVYDSAGTMICQVTIQRDITEQRALEDKLRQSQKMEALGTLVGGVAHEFNNTLAGMTGNLFLARTMAGNNPQLLGKLENIEQLAFRGAGMVGQLLAFARKSPTSMQDFDLAALIKETCKMHRVVIPESIAIETQFCDRALPVHGDAHLLQQVLMNMLNNARDALDGQEEPLIRIRLQRHTEPPQELRSNGLQDMQDYHEQYALLSIEDNGCGIRSENLEHIFEPFFTTKEVGKGTGLGLAMSYGTVQSHRGCIRVHSEPGRGTRMDVFLPLLQGKQQSNDDASLQLQHGNGETILLADDEAGLRVTTRQILETLGYRVLEADNGKTALELYDRHTRDVALLLLDVVMPEMSGVQVAQHVLGNGGKAGIILMTGYNPLEVIDSEDLADIPRLGKPMDIAYMSSLIAAQITRHSR